MQLYKFSPIASESELFSALQYIHEKCHELCQLALGEKLPVVGLIGYFCHYSEEFASLKDVQRQLTNENEAVNGKYFRLESPVTFDDSSYDYLYIRQPDPYRHHVGDIDFSVTEEAFARLQKRIEASELPYARLYPGTDKAMIELFHPDYDVLAYVTMYKGGAT